MPSTNTDTEVNISGVNASAAPRTKRQQYEEVRDQMLAELRARPAQKIDGDGDECIVVPDPMDMQPVFVKRDAHIALVAARAAKLLADMKD